MASLLSTIAALPVRAWQSLTGSARRLGHTMAGMVGQHLKPVWPPEADTERLRRYEAFEKLYQGEQEKFFATRRFRQASPNRAYICVNLLGGATDLLATRAYGEGFEVAAPSDDEVTQEFLESIIADNRLRMVAYDQCVCGIRNGDKAYRIVYRGGDEQRIVVQALDPEIVFPEWDRLDETHLVAANIDQVLQVDDKHVYLWRERHEVRDGQSWVLNKLFRMDTSGTGASRTYYFSETEDEVPLDTLDETTGLSPEEPTGIDALLVVWQRGETAYTDALLSLQGEYNHLVTQKSHLFDKHLPAILAGPPPAAEAQDGGGNVDPDRLRYFAVDQGASMPVSLLEWTAAGFGAADEHLKAILAGFAFTAGVDVAALVPEAGQAAASGTALRRQQMKTQGTVQGLQRYDEPTLQQVFSVCCKLGATLPLAWEGGTPAPLECAEITITFADGLPPDRVEEVDEHTRLVMAGIESKADANKALFGGTDEDAQERVAEAQAEQQANRPPSPFGATTALPGAAGSRFPAVTPGAAPGAQ